MNGQRAMNWPLLWKSGLVLLLLAMGFVVSCTKVSKHDTDFVKRPSVAKPNQLKVTQRSWSQLTGWGQDDLATAMISFENSCRVFRSRSPDRLVGRTTLGGRIQDWLPACQALTRVDPNNSLATRLFFEQHFIPYAVLGHKSKTTSSDTGTFTGYYEAELFASRRRQGAYIYPIYKPPHYLILEGEKASRLDQFGRLMKFHDRQEIEGGVIANQNNEILWGNDPVDIFMLHIQGSGLARLDDGTTMRLSYAAHNGHKFASIVSAMEAEGFSRSYGLDIQSMSRWLKSNPAAAWRAMLANPRYIFFQPNSRNGAIGAQGVPLTPQRSLAVDPAFIPLGAPLWLDTRAHNGQQTVPLRRMVIAQDTGNAIKGPVRGDFFWGSGKDALTWAGNMKQQGTYHILLPRNMSFNGV
jgi:membrane-bound lytic murein transglycosylase A